MGRLSDQHDYPVKAGPDGAGVALADGEALTSSLVLSTPALLLD